MIKTKDFTLKVKAVEETGQIEGYASVFGNVDSANEIVLPGAFADSLAAHKKAGTTPLMLWQHNTDEPIGVWDDLADDGKGLFVKGTLLKGVQVAEEAFIRLKAGAVRGMSIGYRIKASEPNKDKPGVINLKSLDLLEASIVSLPANRRARVEAVKGESWGKLEEFMKALRDGEPRPIKEFEDILRDAGAPKSLAVQIASVGYAKAVRSESDGKAIDPAVTALLKDAVSRFTISK